MKNLIIITSVINISDKPLNYTNTRSVYSIQERYEQSLKSIDSCKLIKDSEILFVETSDIPCDMEDRIKSLVDYYINFKDDEKIQNIINNPIKGKAEATQIWNGLKHVNINDYDNIIKISGRYWLNDSFLYSNYDNDENIFKEGPNKIALGTAMYKVNKKSYKKYIKCIEYCMNSNGQLEKDFVKYFKNDYVTYNKIGLSGHVSVNGKLINW